ncbi:MAG: cytochrome c biogenesis protein ResB [Pyrinomonadaceae bacterium MAG19_C2-C3]|nr:cytochrome c biogenesis protein ResB [Pyrinomonadaceae bacterium MAG19_C2-C3]
MSAAPQTTLDAPASPLSNTTSKPDANAAKNAAKSPPRNIVNQVLDVLSSVRLGVVLLITLIILSMTGMLIMQQEVEGFAAYYALLTPAQRSLYGSLGLFDIYHVWYFRLLLLVLSVNIILASIDRFPRAWTFIKSPKLDAGLAWLRGQKPSATFEMRATDHDELVKRITTAARAEGLRARVSEKGGRTFVFAQRGTWNRLGAYAVHVGLLTIFTGGFLTSYIGRTGQMPLSPEANSPRKRANTMSQTVFNLDQLGQVKVQLPFAVECLDIKQTLIENNGGIDAGNTLDWSTDIRITDEYGTREGVVSLNNPYDYRGYRLFQASYNPTGNARNIMLRLTPQDGRPVQQVTIPRDGETILSDGTRIQYADFFPDFFLNGSRPDTRSTEYNNPAAQLIITPPNAAPVRGFAFASDLPDSAPVSAPVAGYKLRITDFEKVGTDHILSVQRDPGSTVFYVGSSILILTLCAVFFFSHQRFWVSIPEANNTGIYEVTIGANTNRNQQGLEDRFARLTNRMRGIAPTTPRDDDD